MGVAPAASFAVHVARMPRDMGASVGVNDTETGRSRCGRKVLFNLRGMPVHSPDAVRRHRTHHLSTEQVRLEGFAGTGRATRGDNDDVVVLE
jgi:hypothetical protein